MNDSEREAAGELLACVRGFHARGWCDGTGGNFSRVLGRDPLRLLITPSGRDKSGLGAGDLLVVGPDGRAEGAERPSAETALHLAIVAETAAAAVLHTHSVWGTLLGEHFVERGGFHIGGYEMLKGIDGVASHDDRVFVPVVANSQDMAVLAAEISGRMRARPAPRAVLIAGHGLYAWGRDLGQARRHVEIHEFLFQLAGRRIPLVPFDGA